MATIMTKRIEIIHVKVKQIILYITKYNCYQSYKYINFKYKEWKLLGL
jgi:hypothetical protein